MKNSKGFSLIEVVVTMSIMSVIGLGLSTMIQNQANTVYYLEDQLAHQNFKKEVENLLMDTTVCEKSMENIRVPAALVSASPNSGSDFTIKDSAGQVIYNPGNDNLNKFDNIKIAKIKVQNIDLTDPLIGGKVNISVDIERLRGAKVNNNKKINLKSINIEKLVSVDAGMNVVGCENINGAGDSGADSCLENSGGSGIGNYYDYTTRQQISRTSVRIPADAKAMRIVASDHNCSGSGGGGAGNGWSATGGGGSVTFPLNGKVVVGSTPIKAGGTISMSSRNILYNGRIIGTLGRCAEGSTPTTFVLPSSNLAMCAKTSDFSEGSPGHGGGGTRDVTSFSVSYWK